MAEIHVNDIAKSYGRRHPVVALKNASFQVGDGEMLVLLGPSGCGKSTTLRAITGLETPDNGEIRFGNRTVFSRLADINVPVHRRDVGLVFQSFALWPHMTARRNIEFPLRSQRVVSGERQAMVGDIAQKLDLSSDLLDKRPGKLSGGQQQRVALARALVARPSVVLFDEPLSSLDALLRESLRVELRAMHRELGFTGVYVTHDLTEALSLGDRVAVMDAGEVRQIGAAEAVFEHPATARIARVLGLRCLGTFERVDGRVVSSTARFVGDLEAYTGRHTSVDAYCRPERLRITENNAWSDDPGLTLAAVKIREVSYLGSQAEVVVEVGAERLRVLTSLAMGRLLKPDDEITLTAGADDVRFFASDSGSLLTEAEGL